MVPLSVLQTHDVIQILNTKPISAFVHRDLLETSAKQVNECNKFGIAYYIILLSLPSSVFKDSFFEELCSIFKLMNTPDQSRVGEGISNWISLTQRIINEGSLIFCRFGQIAGSFRFAWTWIFFSAVLWRMFQPKTQS